MRDAETQATAWGEEDAKPPRRPGEETARLGKEIYERDVRPEVETGHHGEVVAIDVDSGRWAVADGVIAARESLRALCPEAVNVLFERVGYRALDSFGALTATRKRSRLLEMPTPSQ